MLIRPLQVEFWKSSEVHQYTGREHILYAPEPGVYFSDEIEGYQYYFLERKVEFRDRISFDMYGIHTPKNEKPTIVAKHVHFSRATERSMPKYTVTDIEAKEWMYTVRDKMDLFKNPLNTHLHEYLWEEDTPMYAGEHVYVGSNRDIYLKMSESIWIPTLREMPNSRHWIETHEDLLPQEIIQDFKRYKLMKNLMK